MEKILLQDVFKRAEINNIRINFFYFIVEIFRDKVIYKFCYNFNYNDNAEECDFYTIADELQSDCFEVSRTRFLEAIEELEKMPSYGFQQLTKLHNCKYLDR